MSASWFAATLPLAAAGLGIEAATGYPDALFRAVGHPVSWMGRLLSGLDRGLNRDTWSFAGRRAAGVLGIGVLLAATAAACLLATAVLPAGWTGCAATALICATLPAQRSLDQHVRAVALALQHEGLEAGRLAVARIVGRNPAALDEAGVVRAAIESLAENFADGVVGPAVWIAAGGLTGGALYKATNTADSMVGHRTARHEAFGWAAARFDDLVNLPASRLAAAWILAASLVSGDRPDAAWRVVWRDAARHRSPNAGWPEAAMAGALGLKLGGPRTYGEVPIEAAYIGDGRHEATAADIWRALRLYRIACAVQLLVLAAGALLAIS